MQRDQIKKLKAKFMYTTMIQAWKEKQDQQHYWLFVTGFPALLQSTVCDSDFFRMLSGQVLAYGLLSWATGRKPIFIRLTSKDTFPVTVYKEIKQISYI